jgi:hypothetical protein
MENNKHLIVIEYSHKLDETNVIGVASDIVKARDMRDIYFGEDLTVNKVEDMIDSGLLFEECTLGEEKDEVILIYRVFVLNEI